MSGPTTPSTAEQTAALTPGGIMQLGFGFWASKTLLSAVELKVFGTLSEAGPLNADELGERLGLHPRGARDFFDALVALRMLDRTGGRYSNTPETDLFLDPAKPTYVGGVLEMSNARLYTFWGSLTEGLRTGQPQSEVKTGGDFFETLYADPEKLAQFTGAMTGLSRAAGDAIAAKFRWRDYGSVIDIGCAQGAVPAASRRPTTICPAVVSTCRPLNPSSTPMSPSSALPTASGSRRATSSTTRCPAPTCSSWATSCTTGSWTRSASSCRRHTMRCPPAAH